jgi:hypothetical protein
MSDVSFTLVDGGSVNLTILSDQIPVTVGSPQDGVGVAVYLDQAPTVLVMDSQGFVLDVIQGVPSAPEIVDCNSVLEQTAAFAAGAKIVLRLDLIA